MVRETPEIFQTQSGRLKLREGNRRKVSSNQKKFRITIYNHKQDSDAKLRSILDEAQAEERSSGTRPYANHKTTPFFSEELKI